MTANAILTILTLSPAAHAWWYADGTEATETLSEDTTIDETLTYVGDDTTLSSTDDGTYTLETESTPSLSDCQDLDWLNDRATTSQQSACVSVLASAAQADIDDADQRGELRTGTRVFEDASGNPSEVTVVRGSVMEEWEHRASYYDPTAQDLTEQGYESDGDWIDSCEEYGYQRFYDYSMFQQASRTVDDRYRAISDAAFDSAYIGLGAIGIEGELGYDFETRDGQVYSEDQFGPGPWSASSSDPSVQVRPKNTFFNLTDDEIDAIELLDPTMAATLRTGREYWRTTDQAMSSRSAVPTSGAVTIENRWHFHDVQSARLGASSSDAMLDYYREKRQAFAKVVQQRRRMLADGVNPLDIGDWVYQQNLDETISGYDAELYNLLLEAQSKGCLDIHTTATERENGTWDFHACDWAPRDFHDEVVVQAESLKNAAVEECVAVADFTALNTNGGYDWYDTNGTLTSEADPRHNVDDFKTYLERKQVSQENYVKHAVQSYNVQQKGIPWNSYQWSGGDTYGNTDYFAASWNAGVGWHLFNTAGGQVCDVNPWFKATGDFNAHVFSHKAEILEAVVDFHVRRDRRIVDFEVLGYDLITESWENQGYSTDRRIDYTYTYDKTWQEQREFARGDASFVVWVIPFTVSGGVSGRVGVNYGMQAKLTEQAKEVTDSSGNIVATDCYDLVGELGVYARPYAALDGQASMGVGVPGFSGGVYGRLTLLEVSVPGRVTATARSNWDASDIEIGVKATCDLEVESLSGEVGLYADIFFIRHEHELYRWRGLKYSTPLFETDHSIELQVWGGVCTLPGVDCSG